MTLFMLATVPVLDVLLVVLEFVALFAITWIAWFAVVTLWQFVTGRTRRGRSYPPATPKV